MKTIMVQMADRKWTMQALHLACALARNNHAEVVLLRLTPVKNLGLLGSELANVPPSDDEYEDLGRFGQTAEDYGVPMRVQPMQYTTLIDAIDQAAEFLGAQAVFAKLPQNAIPYWRKFQVWSLSRSLASRCCQLYTLDEPTTDVEWTPSVTVKAAK
jgi:hypothetical protein